MPFLKNGFLGAEAKTFAEGLRKGNPAWYAFALTLNEYANDILPKMDVFNKDGQCAVRARSTELRPEFKIGFPTEMRA